MPRGGDFVSLFRPGARSFALKSCPRAGRGILTEKLVAPVLARCGGGGGGRMVTGQIDTCITCVKFPIPNSVENLAFSSGKCQL